MEFTALASAIVRNPQPTQATSSRAPLRPPLRYSSELETRLARAGDLRVYRKGKISTSRVNDALPTQRPAQSHYDAGAFSSNKKPLTVP